MSGITSVVTPIFSGLAQGAVKGPLNSGVQSQFDRALNKQQQAVNNLQLQQATDAAGLQRDALLSQSQQDTAARQQKLKTGLAKARAHFAGQGIDPDDGSAAALQAATIDDDNTAQQFADADLNNRMTQIDQNLGNIQARNLLQRSQTAQRQQLGYIRNMLPTF